MDKNDVRIAAMHALMVPEHEMVDSVARAILAERKRCEKIAKRVWRDADFYENDAARRAASLIRCRIETGASQ